MPQQDLHQHQPVLLDEVLHGLRVDPSGLYVDATYGRGGHSREILRHLNPQGRLICFDKDPEACKHGAATFVAEPRFEIRHGSFVDIRKLIDEEVEVSGILFDLGVSSPQIDIAERGFSFQLDGPLDMRMDPSQGISAAEWLNRASVKEIAKILKIYGEERNAVRIAKMIKQSGFSSFSSTFKLAKLVAGVAGFNSYNTLQNPAARTFLALRLYLNHELEDLSEALQSARRLLCVGGRLVVISFHSLEDRIVKRFIARYSKPKAIPKKLPVADDYSEVDLKPVVKFIEPSDEEIKDNPRSRSARMRVAEKVLPLHSSGVLNDER